MCDNNLNKIINPETFLTINTSKTGKIRLTILNEKDSFTSKDD